MDMLLLIPVITFAPAIMSFLRKQESGKTNGFRVPSTLLRTGKHGMTGLALWKRCLCVLLAYTMLLNPAWVQQEAQAAINYGGLTRGNWGMINREIHYYYDDNGSCVKKIRAVKDTPDPDTVFLEKTVYVYNLANQLEQVKVTTNGIGWDVTAYKYNDDGIRVEKNVNGTVTTYLVDSYNHTGYAQVLEERTNDVLTKTYIIGDDVIGEVNNYGTLKYYLCDGQGSVRHHTNASGALISYYGSGQNCDTFAYDAYGNRVDPLKYTAGVTEGLFYCGEQYDAKAKMYYLRSRYYNPLTGLFNQMDSFAGSPQDPQSLHKYLYAHNNPVNGVDPSGQEFIGSIVNLINTISIRALLFWMDYGGIVLTVLTKAVYVTAGLYAASSLGLLLIEWGYLPQNLQNYIEAVKYYSGVGFVLSVVALGLLSTLPDPRVKPQPPQNTARLPQDKAVDGRPSPVPKATSRPVSDNPFINAEKNRDVERLYKQGAIQVRVDQRQSANLTGGNIVQKGLNRPDTQGIFTDQPARHIEYDTRLDALYTRAARIQANDPEALIILKWFDGNGNYTIVPW